MGGQEPAIPAVIPEIMGVKRFIDAVMRDTCV